MPPLQRSHLTDAVVRYLAPFEKDARIGYEELSAAVGARLTSTTAAVVSARRILERRHNAVWLTERPGVGLHRLTDREIATRQNSWFLRGARNKLNNGAVQADVVEIDKLDIDEQARFATDSIIRELARESLSRVTRHRIEKVARGTSNDLPSFNAVEWMITLSPTRRRERRQQQGEGRV